LKKSAAFMKFQIGDRVLVLHSNEEGEVVDIINNKMVMVDVRGVKFPAYIDQLDFPYFKMFTEKKAAQQKGKTYVDQLKKEKPNPVAKQVVDGVWLMFLPTFEMDEFGDDIVESFKLHLLNHTALDYEFTYKEMFFKKAEFQLTNKVYGFKDFYLHDMPFEDLNDSPTFSFDFVLVTPDKNKADHYESFVKIKPKQLFDKIQEIKEKGEPSFSYLLFDEYPDRPAEVETDIGILANAGYKVIDAKEARKHLEPARSVLDLHIEKLTDDWQNMSPIEKLAVQLRTFEKYIDLAIAHHLSSMIVIHGIGSGKLKDEIHELLKYRRDVKSFINQYDPRFGYGATEVYFK
jgi:hypothetical protein